jgi:uncharacterized protein (DUF169 family)
MSVQDTEEYKIRKRRVDKLTGALEGAAIGLAHKQSDCWAEEKRKQMAERLLRIENVLQKARNHKMRLYK